LDTTKCTKKGCSGDTYFESFKNKEHKNIRLAQAVYSEKKTLIIYVSRKRKRNYVIKTKLDIDLVKKYLLELYNS
jgi:hypothetical protein